MRKHTLHFIAALLMACSTGCVAETVDEDEGAIVEDLLIDEEQTPSSGVNENEPVQLPAEATPQRHDPPPNPWKPDEGFSNSDDDGLDIDIQQLPELEVQIPR